MNGLKAWFGAAVLLAAALFFPGAAIAAPQFPALTGRVVDDAHILSDATRAQLTQKLAALEQATGRQLVVVTLPSLQGYEIADYGYQLRPRLGHRTEKQKQRRDFYRCAQRTRCPH